MPAIDFKDPDWYQEEDINIFREAVNGFYTREMAPHSESFRKNKVVDRKYWNMAQLFYARRIWRRRRGLSP